MHSVCLFIFFFEIFLAKSRILFILNISYFCIKFIDMSNAQSNNSLKELNAKLLVEIDELKKRFAEIKVKNDELVAEKVELKARVAELLRQSVEENKMRDTKVNELEQKNIELEARLAIVEQGSLVVGEE